MTAVLVRFVGAIPPDLAMVVSRRLTPPLLSSLQLQPNQRTYWQPRVEYVLSLKDNRLSLSEILANLLESAIQQITLSSAI